jgi:hypothetical protein
MTIYQPFSKSDDISSTFQMEMISMVDKSDNNCVKTERLRTLIDSKKSQKEVADGTGQDKSQVSNHYNGKSVSFAAAIKYAEYFHVSVDYLIGRVENPTENPTTAAIH